MDTQYRLEWPRPAKAHIGPEWLRDDEDAGVRRRWHQSGRLLVWGELARAQSGTYDTRPYSPFETLGVLPALVRVDQAWRDRRPLLRPGEAWTPPSLPDDPVAKAVASFVEDFGVLGQVALGGKRAVVQVDRASGDPYPAEADDLAWLLDHAHQVHLLMSLAAALRGRIDDKRLHRLLRNVRGVNEGFLAPRRIATVRDPWWTSMNADRWWRKLGTDFDAAIEDAGGPVSAAKCAFSMLLTPNLADVPLVIDPESGRPAFQFRALIQAVYWMLADRWGIGRRPKRCKEDGALFFADDGRERFCPPPPGVKESRCGRRWRMRRLRGYAK